MHCESKELDLRMDSLHKEMSKIFTERGSSYNKEEKKGYPPQLFSFSVPTKVRHEKTLRSEIVKSIVTLCVLRALIFPALLWSSSNGCTYRRFPKSTKI